MYKVKDFIKWALTHVKGGAEPWNYLFGSVRVRTDQATLDRYFENHYKSQMTRERYDQLTADWPRDGYATDCQGLLDAWLTYEAGVPTDINADTNYRLWCTDKGKIGDINRGWVIGEAVFHYTGTRMDHIGWICGFMPDGEPLVLEARGIAYGVVVTRRSRRDFPHRGLMTAKFDYNAAPDEPQQEEKPMEPIVLKRTSPMMQGDGIRLMQQALNALGYTDDAGRQLDEDGKCGSCTMQAVQRFANAHTTIPAEHTPEPEAPVDEPTTLDPVMQFELGKEAEYTVCVFRTADLEEMMA
jgi:hypothetical protein